MIKYNCNNLYHNIFGLINIMNTEVTPPTQNISSLYYYPDVSDYWELLKPRVMSLVIFTSITGALAAPSTTPATLIIAALFCVAVGAGACGALNMWWDHDIDRIMQRTKNRSIPAGRMPREHALIFGGCLAVSSVIFIFLFANLLSAALLSVSILFYLFVYTIWLKRTTPVNVVIGGISGALPPVIGWTIAQSHITIEPILLFMIIFLWTPPHSWALMLFRRDDYVRAEIPVLPVSHGDKATRRAIMRYSVILVPVSMSLGFTDIAGVYYVAVVAVCNVILLAQSIRILRRTEDDAILDNYATERTFFRFSIMYLFIIFCSVIGSGIIRDIGLYFYD